MPRIFKKAIGSIREKGKVLNRVASLQYLLGTCSILCIWSKGKHNSCLQGAHTPTGKTDIEQTITSLTRDLKRGE